METSPTCRKLEMRKKRGSEQQPAQRPRKPQSRRPEESPNATTTTMKRKTESEEERGRLGGTFPAIIQASANRSEKTQVKPPRDATKTLLYIYESQEILKMQIQSCFTHQSCSRWSTYGGLEGSRDPTSAVRDSSQVHLSNSLKQKAELGQSQSHQVARQQESRLLT